MPLKNNENYAANQNRNTSSARMIDSQSKQIINKSSSSSTEKRNRITNTKTKVENEIILINNLINSNSLNNKG